MTDKLKDVALRAVKTFWQSTLAALMVAMPSIIDLIPSGWKALSPVLISTLVGALSAGLSAVWNGVIAPHLKKNVDNIGEGGFPLDPDE